MLGVRVIPSLLLRGNGLVELETVRSIEPCLVVNRSAYQLHREELNRWLHRFEAAEVVV